jgi:hypothetical protein
MVSSQSVVGNRKPKLFSQLNELYGNTRTVRSAAITTGVNKPKAGGSTSRNRVCDLTCTIGPRLWHHPHPVPP